MNKSGLSLLRGIPDLLLLACFFVDSGLESVGAFIQQQLRLRRERQQRDEPRDDARGGEQRLRLQ